MILKMDAYLKNTGGLLYMVAPCLHAYSPCTRWSNNAVDLFPLFLSLYHFPLSGFAFLGHFLGAIISFVTLFWWTGCCHWARPSGRDGRQETEKIVCRHSLDRLNASMIKQKKKKTMLWTTLSHQPQTTHTKSLRRQWISKPWKFGAVDGAFGIHCLR